MLFLKEFVIPILLGQKIVTRREKRPRMGVGRVYKAQQKLFTPDYFAEIKANKIYQQPLGEMVKQDFKDEGFGTREEFIEVWEEITKSPIDETQEVWVIEFELVRVGPNYAELVELIKDDGIYPQHARDLPRILKEYPELVKFFPEKKKDLPTEQERLKPERDSTIDEILAEQAYIQAQLQELADQKVEIANESIGLQKEFNALEHQRRRLLVNERHSRRHRRIRRATG